MRTQPLALAAFFLMLGIAAAGSAVYLIIQPSKQHALKEAEPPRVAVAAASTAPADLRPQAPEKLAQLPILDFMRIAPSGGVSVLAGRAKPGTHVSVVEGGKVLGFVQADGNGEWSFVTEHAFAAGEPKIELREGRPPTAEVAVAARPTPTLVPAGPPRSVTAVETEVVRNLEAAVSAARAAAAAAPGTRAEPRVASAETAVPPKAAISTTDVPQQASNAAVASRQLTEFPVPITFVYREARPTPLGEKAARLLVDYVRLKGVDSIELTGHADERGSDDFNLQLSRQRLEAIENVLRSGGYQGRIILVPKGSSEPYRGVDRRALPLEDLYQLDRRVELRRAG
jgi:outer membrane protein OmpA-like peptidoglycan-associated protein